MTATRWWVKMYARWQARIDSSLQEINLGLRMISSGGIGSASLAYLGHTWLVLPFLVGMVITILAYAYLTFEGGVKNQVARDRADMIGNFSGPSMYIDDVLIGVAVFTAVNGRPPDKDELEQIESAVGDQWEDFREGISLDDDAT